METQTPLRVIRHHGKMTDFERWLCRTTIQRVRDAGLYCATYVTEAEARAYMAGYYYATILGLDLAQPDWSRALPDIVARWIRRYDPEAVRPCNPSEGVV